MHPRGILLLVFTVGSCLLRGLPSGGASLEILGEAVQGRPLEFRIGGIPTATNVFDPAVIAVDAEFTEPDGNRRRVPAFWYRAYTRALVSGTETLNPAGPGEWRLRYFPRSAGAYAVQVQVRLGTTGTTVEGPLQQVPVRAGSEPVRGFARVAGNGQFFETSEGTALPLVGADTCWHGNRGTYDYDLWLPAMAAAGWNWGRLWMAPWAFGIETAPGERLAYRLDRAWQLDRVLDAAAERGIRMLLCLDYHGMFETQPDYWGGNNHWTRHPYNVAHGGPCATPRSFFTDPEARRLYQARLRYLVARYGAHPGLFAWQFLNEIDNVYRLLDATEVARWHAEMGGWLAAHDPWSRPRTTSLTSQSDRPEIWSLSELDFAVYHAYSLPAPARRLAETVASMRQRYRKPVLIGEVGVDWRGWARDTDPFLRGFRQLLWGGIASGSAGTSMSWWWESIHQENVYPLYTAATKILAETTWGSGLWEPLRLRTPAPAPSTVGALVPDGRPFDVQLALDGSWGSKPPGLLALPQPEAAGLAAQRLNSFVHGSAHNDLRVPFRIDAWLADEARLVLHLNSVSDGGVLTVRVDGSEIFRRALANKDGKWEVNQEYNEDISVPLPAGRHTVEIRNAGADWFFLDWVRFERVLPSQYADDWQPSPVAVGLRKERELLLYLVAPGLEYPAQATVREPSTTPPSTLTISNVPPGTYIALWFDPAKGTELARSTGTVAVGHSLLQLRSPPLAEDAVGHIFPAPRLEAEGFDLQGRFHLGVDGLHARAFGLESSRLDGVWETRPAEFEHGPGKEGPRIIDPTPRPSPHRAYRLRLPEVLP